MLRVCIHQSWRQVACLLTLLTCLNTTFAAEPDPGYLQPAEAIATTETEMKPYTQKIRDTGNEFDMLPIPGGEFIMGSPKTEENRGDDEGPQHKVKVEPFWMGKHEVTWDLYDTWRLNLDIQRRELAGRKVDNVDKEADAVTRPTKEYTDMTFGMGHDGYPAICMTQLAAKMYCQWLTAKTGFYHRLPTEAEWEYACRAGTTTAYSFGDSAENIDEYAWYFDNSDESYNKVGLKKPNPWGLYDMHGNVCEWCLDQYLEDFYGETDPNVAAIFPVAVPTMLYSRVTRGGSWYDDPEDLRSSKRIPSSEDWKIQDPQLPQSMWYHTDADFVGFRVIRPFKQPTAEEIQKYVLYPDIPDELRK